MAFSLQPQEEKQLTELAAWNAVTGIEQAAVILADLLVEAIDERYAKRRKREREHADTAEPKCN